MLESLTCSMYCIMYSPRVVAILWDIGEQGSWLLRTCKTMNVWLLWNKYIFNEKTMILCIMTILDFKRDGRMERRMVEIKEAERRILNWLITCRQKQRHVSKSKAFDIRKPFQDAWDICFLSSDIHSGNLNACQIFYWL
jgi:hypothetical protein